MAGYKSAHYRVSRVAPPPAAIEELCALAVETFDLVEQWLPNADVASARAAFESRRTS